MTVKEKKEKRQFQAEARQLMDLMINALYSNKEIFLRELISNASDAADKLRFEALSDDALYEEDSELQIRVAYDKKARTVTVSDNGIGMTRDEVVNHIGTIAKSGTRQFVESLSGDKARDANLIGQFGVGFYSSFIVADKVTLTTRKAGLNAAEGVRWESEGKGDYILETAKKPTRGTEIVLHLRKDEDEFLDGFRLRNIIHKYSNHISLPIVMKSEDKEKKDEDETINRASALWTRPKNEIDDDEYNEFYKHVAHDFEDPLAHIHSRVEGNNEYVSLLYIPSRAPFDLWDPNSIHGLKLYVRRIFIMDDSKELMPRYLRFVRGIVDSNDLPLNISREILQHNKTIDSIRAGSVKKILGLLEDMATNDKEKYTRFWKEFGKVIKEGPAEDFANKEQIAKLLRFASTDTGDDTQNVSLQDYVSRMKKDQDKIYYITADSFSAAKNSPHLEIFNKKEIEVLLLSDRVDEWMLSSLTEYEGKPLQSIAKGTLDLGELTDKEEKEEQNKIEKESKDFVKRIKEALDDKVKDVSVTTRLTTSPACLVAGEHDISANLQRMLESAGQDVPNIKPILEINLEHPLVKMLEDEKDDTRFSDLASILHDQALLSEGGQLPDPASFVHKLNGLVLEMANNK